MKIANAKTFGNNPYATTSDVASAIGSHLTNVGHMPSGGTAGNYLRKTEDGTEWADVEIPNLSATIGELGYTKITSENVSAIASNVVETSVAGFETVTIKQSSDDAGSSYTANAGNRTFTFVAGDNVTFTNGDNQVTINAVGGTPGGATSASVSSIASSIASSMIDTRLTSVYTYKGSVENYSSLPNSDQKVGDTYNVKNADDEHGIKAGDNVAWNGTGWDDLSGQVDLTSYALKSEAATDHNHDSQYLKLAGGTLTGSLSAPSISVTGSITEGGTALSSKYATKSHSHAISDVTGLQTTLDGKAASSHTHAVSDVTGLQNVLDGKAALSHSHGMTDVNGLQDALNAKADADAIPVGTILPYFGCASTFSFSSEYSLNYFELDIPSGWHFCDGSIFVDCTADPRKGEELYFGHNYNVYSESNKLNRLWLFNDDTLIMCFYYYYYPYLNSDGNYVAKYIWFVKPERVGYLKTGDIADRSEYGFVYRYYVSDEFKNSDGDVALPNKVSSLDMLNHAYESENSAKVSEINETPFLILNEKVYRFYSHHSDTVYCWHNDVSGYCYTKKSETTLNNSRPVCYTTSSLSTSAGTARRCYMRPFYPLTFAPQTIMRGYLPNLNGLMPLGTDNAKLTGAILPATLPNIRGTMSNPFAVSTSSTSTSEAYNYRLHASADGPFRDIPGSASFYSRGSGTKAGYSELEFDASKANPIYQDGATVRPPSFGVNWIIKI